MEKKSMCKRERDNVKAEGLDRNAGHMNAVVKLYALGVGVCNFNYF